MELQVEEDAIPALDERADDGRTLEREEALADLEAADLVAELVGQLERPGPAFDVECD